MEQSTSSRAHDVLSGSWVHTFATDDGRGREHNIPKLENGGIGAATSVELEGLLETPRLEDDDMEMVDIPSSY